MMKNAPNVQMMLFAQDTIWFLPTKDFGKAVNIRPTFMNVTILKIIAQEICLKVEIWTVKI